MRSAPVAAAVLLCLVAQLACSNEDSPCTQDCPPLEGAWALRLADGGTPSDPDEADCTAAGITAGEGTLAIEQDGAGLEASFLGTRYSGLAYATQAFSLQSRADGGIGDTTVLRGRFVRTGAPDAGTGTLEGTLTRTARADAGLCTLLRSFRAERE